MTTNKMDYSPVSKKKIEEMLNKHPNRVPIIISSTSFKEHGQHRFIVPNNITVSEFMKILRNKVSLKQEEAIFIFVKDKSLNNDAVIVPSSSSIESIYNQYKDNNMVLNLIYEKEAVFG
jgi:microtubule-associated protein 1 light chain